MRPWVFPDELNLVLEWGGIARQIVSYRDIYPRLAHDTAQDHPYPCRFRHYCDSYGKLSLKGLQAKSNLPPPSGRTGTQARLKSSAAFLPQFHRKVIVDTAEIVAIAATLRLIAI